MDFLDVIPLNHWTWLVTALVLLGLEMAIPGVVFMWMAIASAIMGGIVFFLPDISWEVQFITFAILSIISVFAGRGFLKRHPIASDDSTLNQRGRQYIGQTFTLTRDMENGKGRVRIGDGTWNVTGDFDAHTGEKVKVIDVDATVLIVEKMP